MEATKKCLNDVDPSHTKMMKNLYEFRVFWDDAQ